MRNSFLLLTTGIAIALCGGCGTAHDDNISAADSAQQTTRTLLGGWTMTKNGTPQVLHACFWSNGRWGSGDFEYNIDTGDRTWTAVGTLFGQAGIEALGAWRVRGDVLSLSVQDVNAKQVTYELLRDEKLDCTRVEAEANEEDETTAE